jgi:hypothetical protein
MQWLGLETRVRFSQLSNKCEKQKNKIPSPEIANHGFTAVAEVKGSEAPCLATETASSAPWSGLPFGWPQELRHPESIPLHITNGFGQPGTQFCSGSNVLQNGTSF